LKFSISFPILIRLLAIGVAPLCLTSCTLLATLINTVLGVGMQAAQVKLLYRCVPQGVAIDTPIGPRNIEDLGVGDLVIGYSGEPVTILQKHEYLETDQSEKFMLVTFENDAQVRVCDMHRIGGKRSMDMELGTEVEGHTVSAIERFGGVAISYDLLTEDHGYRINGIPVNSMIEEMGFAMQRRVGNRSEWQGRNGR
jgi:hypothetical protein